MLEPGEHKSIQECGGRGPSVWFTRLPGVDWVR